MKRKEATSVKMEQEDINNVLELAYSELMESKTEFGDRIAAFMRELEALDCQNVAVFAHAGVMRTFLDTVLDVPMPRDRVCCRNCTVAIFEYEASVWKLHSWINLS